jgi:hypothetical protein
MGTKDTTSQAAPAGTSFTAVGATTADGGVVTTAPGAGQQQPAGDPGLASLADQAAALQGTAQPAGQGAAPGAPAPVQPMAPAIPNSTVFAQLLGAVRDTVCMVAGLEAPKRTLTDEKVDKLGAIWGGVFDHYGIVLSDTMGKFGPVMAAAMASIPLLSDVVIETRKEIDAKDRQRAREPQRIETAPAAAKGVQTTKPDAAPKGYEEGVIKSTFSQ